MFLIEKAVLVVFGSVLGAQVFLRSFFRVYLKYVFMFAVPGVFAVLAYWSAVQYIVWQTDPLAQYLLPPYQGPEYFFSHIGKRFFAPWLIAALAAILVPRIAERLNKRYGERFFYKEEFRLMGLGIFLTGYPGFLFYLALVLSFGVLLSSIFVVLSRGRAPFTYFWMPAGILTVILINWVLPEGFLAPFVF